MKLSFTFQNKLIIYIITSTHLSEMLLRISVPRYLLSRLETIMSILENFKYFIFYSYFSPLLYHRVFSFLHYLLYLEGIPKSNNLIDLQVRLLHFIRAPYSCSFAGVTIYRFVILHKIQTIK